MNIFGNGNKEGEASTTLPATSESTQNTEPYPSKLLDAFDITPEFMQRMAKEENEQKQRLERVGANGEKAFTTLQSGQAIDGIELSQGKYKLVGEAKEPSSLPDAIAATWNTTRTIPLNEQTLGELKTYLGKFAEAALKQKNYLTTVNAVGLISEPNSIIESEQIPRRLILVINESCNNQEEINKAKYQLVKAITVYAKQTEKPALRDPSKLNVEDTDATSEPSGAIAKPEDTQVVDASPDATKDPAVPNPTQVLTESPSAPPATEATTNSLREVPPNDKVPTPPKVQEITKAAA